MSCPPGERLAAAASGEDAESLAHAASCARCGREIDAQRALIARLRTTRPHALPKERRDELAAEIMATLDRPRSTRGAGLLAAGGMLLVAAALALVVVRVSVRVETVTLAVPATEDELVPASTAVAHLEPPSRERDDGAGTSAHEIVRIGDGAVAIDASERKPVAVVAGDTRVVLRSRGKVVARGGLIVTAQVFAGTAEVVTPSGTFVVEAGEMWTRPTASDALGAFRSGWEALRGGRHAEALAAFDRATDEVVAEDAAFWAAIAAERLGDLHGARARLARFLARFPTSPREPDARAALRRMNK